MLNSFGGKFHLVHLDLVIVSSRDKQRLLLVEIDASDRAVVLIKFINQSAHTIVPKLDDAIMQATEDPWSVGVKHQTYKTMCLLLIESQTNNSEMACQTSSSN